MTIKLQHLFNYRNFIAVTEHSATFSAMVVQFEFLISYPNILTVILSLVVIILWLCYVKSRKYPPGPWGIPLFGCVLFKLRGASPLNLARLARQYGNISSIKIGSRSLVVLNDYDTIKEAFIKSNAFINRPVELIKAAGLDNTLLSAKGKDMFKLRRLFLIVTKPKLEDSLTDEINNVLEEFKSFGLEEFDPSQLIAMFSSNIVSDIAFGRRFNYADEEFRRIISSMAQIVRQTVIEINQFFFPWISRIPFLSSLIRNDLVQQMRENMGNIVNLNIERVKTNYVSGSTDNYVEEFLTERQKNIDATGDEGIFTDNCMSRHVLSSFNIGSETSSSGILWTVYLIGKHPNIYDKIKEETFNVIGTNRNPSLKDQPNMPYVNAVVTEIYRCSSASPFSFFYTNEVDTKLSGYLIPKDSIVTANIWSVHNDPNLWQDPETFRPERFIDDKGEFQKSNYVIPFCIGKRRCLAESLVQSLYFLFLTSLCQRFRIEINDTVKSPTRETLSMAIKPRYFKIRVTPI